MARAGRQWRMALDAHPEIARVLRAHLAAHNFRVAVLSTLTLLAAAALWYLLHAAARWLALLFVTATRGIGAQMPMAVDFVFWSVAAALLALAWIAQLLRRDERPKDHKTPGDLVWECVLAVPRLTLSFWGTLSAWQHLDAREIRDAAALVARLRHEPKLRLHSLPVDLPDDARRCKILFALQLVQIIEIRREDRELWVTLNPLRPAALQAPPPAPAAASPD